MTRVTERSHTIFATCTLYVLGQPLKVSNVDVVGMSSGRLVPRGQSSHTNVMVPAVSPGAADHITACRRLLPAQAHSSYM